MIVALVSIFFIGALASDLQERQNVLIENPAIFGIDALGWGVDLRAGLPGEGTFKIPVYENWQYTDAQSYQYPLEPDTVFRVPNNVFVRTLAQKEAYNHYYLSRDEYVKKLNLDIGLGIQYTASQTTNSSSSSPAAPNSTNVNSLDMSSFSGSVGVQYAQSVLSDNRHMLIENSLEVSLWQLVIGPSAGIRQSVADAIAAARADSNPNQAYAEFVDKYGTHYIDSVIVGGRLKAATTTIRSDTNSTERLALMANFGFKKMFGLDSGNLSLSVNFTEDYQKFSTETTNDLEAVGGDPQLNDFFAGTLKPEETFIQWSESLIANPAVIRFRCREISWLFAAPIGNSATRIAVKNVVRSYMAGQTNV